MSVCTVNGGQSANMKPLSSKRLNRIEKKKKKMAALLEIAKLNEYDRANKSNNQQMIIDINSVKENSLTTEPSPKRLKTEESTNNINNTLNKVEIEITLSGKPKLYGEDFLHLKKQLRETTQKMRLQPTFRLREFGEAASIAVEMDNRIPLFLTDIQHLLMYSQLGPHAPYTPARWCQLEKFTKLIHTNLLIIENLSAYDYLSNENSFQFLSNNTQYKLEIVNPNTYKTDSVKNLLMVPLTSTQVKRFMAQYGTLESAVELSNQLFDVVKNLFPIDVADVKDGDDELPKGDNFSRTKLLLSGWQLVEENFPLPVKGLMEKKYTGYVLTKDQYKDVSNNSPMYGLDCEMCKTTGGDLELTRVSIVDENLDVFYEQIVKPDRKIVDYLTRFSGITAKMMKKATKKLAQVQEDLRRMLPPDAILVGQSLSNDLHALKMMHPYIIDTSVIYNITGERSRKTKLQTLSREFLKERIQESKSGHCSVEDSLASLKLTKLKLSHSICYGDAVLSGFEDQLRKHPQLGTTNYATNLFKQIVKFDKTVHVCSIDNVMGKYELCTYKNEESRRNDRIKFHTLRTNDEIIDKICNISKECSLSIGHVVIDDDVQNDGSIDNLLYENVDEWCKKIVDSSPTPGLNLIIFSGNKDGGNGICFIKLKRL